MKPAPAHVTPCASHDPGDRVLAESQVASDPAMCPAPRRYAPTLWARGGPTWVASPSCRPSLRPRARAAARPERTRSLSMSRSNWAVREHRRHHPPMRRIDLERHAAHRDHRHAPARQPVEVSRSWVERPQRLSSVTRIASIAACLRQLHHPQPAPNGLPSCPTRFRGKTRPLHSRHARQSRPGRGAAVRIDWLVEPWRRWRRAVPIEPFWN